MTVVVVFLLADAQGGVDYIVVPDEMYVVVMQAGGGGKAEVLGYDREGSRTRAPLWVGDLFKDLWVVIAPFGFPKSCVGPQNYPIRDGTDE